MPLGAGFEGSQTCAIPHLLTGLCLQVQNVGFQLAAPCLLPADSAM